MTAEGKRKVIFEPEADAYLLSTPPQRQSPSKFIISPEKMSSRYSPKVAQRMQTDTCFKCRRKGHWMVDCPLNSPEGNYPKIYCRCGHGFCEVKTATNNRNNGRKYYACPIKRGKRCADFVRWCDDPTKESDLHPPPYKNPECTRCGAGVCRKETEKSGPNVGRCYFSCPLGEGFGSCGFIVWEDTLLNSTSIVPAQRIIPKNLHYYLDQIDTANSMDDGRNKQLEDSKRMRIMENSQCPTITASSDLPERGDTSQKAVLMERGGQDETAALSSPAIHAAYPDFEAPDDIHDLCIDSIVEDACHQIMISCKHREFERQFSAAASFASVFPSADAIIIPIKKRIRDGPSGESNYPLTSNSGLHGQLLIEVSRDEVAFDRSARSERKLMSKLEKQREIALFAQQQLLDDFESLNPLNHVSIREAAEATFDILDRLSVDYKRFSEHVWEFINHASSLAEIQKSIENSPSPEEHMRRYEEEKVRLDSIRENYVKTNASLELSCQRYKSLNEEASRLKSMLQQIENQLIYCKSETSKIENDLYDINTSMMEAERSLQVAAEQAEAAGKLREERKVKESSAKAALRKAKLELGN